jgi:PKD repeat protein
MRIHDDIRRGFLAMICAGLGACSNSAPDVPRATAISPEQADTEATTLVRVTGQSFHVDGVANVDTGKTEVDVNFVVTLVPEAGGDSVQLQEVVYIDAGTLEGMVPLGTATGSYGVRVTGPSGEGPLQNAALKVYSDYDSDSIHDDVDPCVDVDGDGLGRSPFDTSGCLDPTVDSDDELDTVCADTDEDGCEDCSSGSWSPDNDGEDMDSDGFCAANDCDDDNANCDSDCTDADGDLFCVNHDCDDDAVTGGACAADCLTFFADADGDGFGDAGNSTEACSAPTGFLVDNTDCADEPVADPACNGLAGNLCHPGLAGSDTCDGADNDCDSSLDEDHVATPTSCGVGACAGNTGTLACVAGVVSDSCDPLAGASADTNCNNLDEDCDASSDEGYVEMGTSCGVGECAGNTGTMSCITGVETDSCDPFAGASPENLATAGSCTDTLDNDCDGDTDGAEFSCQGGNNTPPVAAFDVSPPAGDTSTSFAGDAATSFDLEDPFGALTFAWDWDGDGTFEQTGSTSNHVFATPGAHTVTLRVIDSGGLPDFHIFVVSVADPADLIVVTTGVDESDAGATPAVPGGTGLSLREATLFASLQATRQTVFVPATITSNIGAQIDLESGVAGFDLVGDAALVDGSLGNNCLSMTGSASIRILGFEITDCNDGVLAVSGPHIISRNQIHDVINGVNAISADGTTIGPHNEIFACDRGVRSLDPIELIDNIIRDNVSEGARIRGNADGSMVRGNVFARNNVGIDLAQADLASLLHNTLYDHQDVGISVAVSSADATVLNNIIHSAGNSGIDASDAPFALLDNNCYFNTTPCSACTIGGSSTTDDPLFIDEGVDDFRLQSTSTLIDQAVDTGFDVNGAAPGNFDGAAPDIGAHEMP